MVTAVRADAEAVRAELARIKDANDGVLRPSDVLKAARPIDSVLHCFFEWDDATAADLYRLRQARVLCVRYRIEEVKSSVYLAVVPYVRDPKQAPRQQGYVAIEDAREAVDTADAVVRAELRRVAAFIERGRSIAAHLGLSKLFEEGLRELVPCE